MIYLSWNMNYMLWNMMYIYDGIEFFVMELKYLL